MVLATDPDPAVTRAPTITGMSSAPPEIIAVPGSCQIQRGEIVTARLSEIKTLARQPHPAEWPRLPPRFLRHADEQTVVAMAAVLRTLARQGETTGGVTGDAVIAASCRAGQPTAARTMTALERQGPVGVTPHVVPQCSLHSPASAVSVGLGMHGPTIGVGGGPAAIAEGLLAAATLAMSPGQSPAAIWLLLTGWDDQPGLDAAAVPTTDPVCRGLCLQLRPIAAGTPIPAAAASLLPAALPAVGRPESSPGPTREQQQPRPLREFSNRLQQGCPTAVACGPGLTMKLQPGAAGFGIGSPTAAREAA